MAPTGAGTIENLEVQMYANYHPRHADPASQVEHARAYHARHANPASQVELTSPRSTSRLPARSGSARRAAGLLAVGATVVGLSACAPGTALPNPGPTAAAQAVAAQAQQASTAAPTVHAIPGLRAVAATSPNR